MILKLPIISKNKIAQGTWEICFGLKSKSFNFKAGQYIKITLPEVDIFGPKGNMREFSITSSPNNKTSLTIGFRQSDSDFKQALLAHSISDLIKIAGPFGDLILPKNLTDIVMIAGGLGITPFLSMLTYLREQNSTIKVFLIYINSKPETAAFLNLLADIKYKCALFDFIHVKNRLSKEALTGYLEGFNIKTTFMVAGPPDMVRNTRLTLLNSAIPPNQILLEEFTGY